MYARLIGAALAALCLLSLPARADEPTPWNRTGLYVGVVGGYDLAEMKADTFKLSEGSLFAGPFAGFNVRVNPNLVAGIEADYMFMNVKASRTDESVTVTATSNYLASVRGRLGVPIGPALAYGTAGIAMTEHKLSATDGEELVKDKEVQFGGVFGGGIEGELTKTLFVRVEGLHYWFPDKTMAFDGDAFKSGQHQTVVRVGVGFKLN